jgi:hypothetical protein
MQQRELVKSDHLGSFVLALAAHVPESDALLSEGRQFKSIVLDWFAARGVAASKVELMLLAGEGVVDECLDFFQRLHQQEVDLDPIFRQAAFGLTVLAGERNESRFFPVKK